MTIEQMILEQLKNIHTALLVIKFAVCLIAGIQVGRLLGELAGILFK